ncbi:hypothetical protein lam_852 [Candidatus Liberibacter americanus str. Sao Paulo]|uniref:Uncharacterized protein n=1 Tax=Candidatus Liberibacter americanus str. Sao Paulo TaxID=1261131 RepID=U6B8M7_9HYPH|nr:hypothetical protein lam_852 [Candidatus Liberibacter americanus str. Sao Paulo]
MTSISNSCDNATIDDPTIKIFKQIETCIKESDNHLLKLQYVKMIENDLTNMITDCKSTYREVTLDTISKSDDMSR